MTDTRDPNDHPADRRLAQALMDATAGRFGDTRAKLRALGDEAPRPPRTELGVEAYRDWTDEAMQWVAGTGTDASPYFRVFNPVTQGKRFDPDGAYVRRWVPELAHLEGAAAHEPWKHDDGYAHGYPLRIVDHAEERRIALHRYEQVRARNAR